MEIVGCTVEHEAVPPTRAHGRIAMVEVLGWKDGHVASVECNREVQLGQHQLAALKLTKGQHAAQAPLDVGLVHVESAFRPSQLRAKP